MRFVTAASLFDGHDASINIIRRMLQASGAEVIHLGHNRSVDEIVTAALQEDAHGIALSSYQGGHIEFFKYMLDLLRERGGENIKVFGGGGGVIVPAEIRELEAYGVTRIYSPEDGAKHGAAGHDRRHAQARRRGSVRRPAGISRRLLTPAIAARSRAPSLRWKARHCLRSCTRLCCARAAKRKQIPVLGITGTGGSGKSSLTDELIRRFRLDQNDRLQIAVIAVDPSRRKTGGALLGDRIRMNAINSSNIYMRSLATRSAGSEIAACSAGRDRGVQVRRASISSSSRRRASVRAMRRSFRTSTSPLYVMTPEYGAASQLEKIDMLDFADFVAINKFDRRGAEDALRDVRKQFQRNRQAFNTPPEQMPVFGTIASRFNDDGVTALYQAIAARLQEKGLELAPGRLPPRRACAPRPASPASCRPQRTSLSRRDRRDGARLSSARRRGQVKARARAPAAASRRSACCEADPDPAPTDCLPRRL